MKSLRIVLIMMILLVGSAWAEDPPVQRVEVSVLSISNGVARLNHGRRLGIEPGDRVRLFPTGLPTLEGAVLSVRENSCRVEFSQDASAVEPGTTGEVLVPLDRTSSTPLPWTAPAENYDRAQPLLLGRATPAEDRPPSWRGRVFFQTEWTENRGSNSAEYLFGNLGVDLNYENPFGNGGRLHFNADAFSRTANLDLGFDVDDSRLRFDRFSYAWGGTREKADRWQVGRFLHHEFPELGVVDGVEFSHRLDNGNRVGASFGYQPAILEDFRHEDDLQVSIFYRHLAGLNDELALGMSYQRTWHKGRPDRDLVLATIDLKPREDWTIWGSSWIDIYGSDATNKDSNVELTQLIAGVTWADRTGKGLTASLTQTRWPELLRDEFVAPPVSLLADGHVERIRIQGWRPLAEHFRIRGSLDYWSDQDDSGSGGELFLGARDLLWKRGEISAALYARSGKFDDLIGLRLSGFKSTDLGTFRGTIDTTSVEGATFGGTASESQLRLRGSWDQSIGLDWYLSLYAQTVSIDVVDTSTLGLHLQWSF